VLPAVRWVDYSAWVLSCRTPWLRRYGPRSPVHYRFRPVWSGALWRVPTLDEVDTLSPANDCTTRRNRLMANIPAAILRAVAANGERHELLSGTARCMHLVRLGMSQCRGAIAQRSAQQGQYKLYQTRSRSTIPTIRICLIARRTRWRINRSSTRGNTPIPWGGSRRMSCTPLVTAQNGPVTRRIKSSSSCASFARRATTMTSRKERSSTCDKIFPWSHFAPR